MEKSINQWVSEIHATAVDKGWWESGDRPPLEMHMLMVSEIAEATEEARKGTPPIYSVQTVYDPIDGKYQAILQPYIEDCKPEGELIELADAVIRIMDYCGQRGWDLENAIKVKTGYNKTRPHRHGGKKY